jgi:hypothetical protein
MLRKMYLVSQEYLNKSKRQSSPSKRENEMPQPKKRVIKRKTMKSPNAHEKWFRMSNMMREADVNRKTIADFVQKILPSSMPLVRGVPKFESVDFSPSPSKTVTPSVRTFDTLSAPPSSPSTSREIMYETPKPSLYTGEIEEEDVDNEDTVTETDVQHFDTKHFGELASPYVTPYL